MSCASGPDALGSTFLVYSLHRCCSPRPVLNGGRCVRDEIGIKLSPTKDYPYNYSYGSIVQIINWTSDRFALTDQPISQIYHPSLYIQMPLPRGSSKDDESVDVPEKSIDFSSNLWLCAEYRRFNNQPRHDEFCLSIVRSYEILAFFFVCVLGGRHFIASCQEFD